MLKDIRVNAKLTQCDVAEKLNISQVAVSQWEKGICSPQLDRLQQLAKLYGVSTDDVISACEQARTQHQNSA